MNQLPVEEHIRGVVKDLLRTRGYTKRGMEPDINGTLKIPLKGLKHRLSLQASAPYDAVQQAERRDKHLHKIITADKGKDFLAGGKTAVIDNKEAPLAVGEPYLDPWANPMLVKGVPENQKQLLESARTHKALFAPPVAKPFVSRVGGNRSSALPNDVFDVIAEAEETGGAIHRHLGTRTLRFGLPASADARYDVVEDPKASETVIPKAPMRTSSTMRSTTRRYVSRCVAASRRCAHSLALRCFAVVVCVLSPCSGFATTATRASTSGPRSRRPGRSTIKT